MALQVGELFATLRLDDDQFNRGLDDSRGRFEGLRSAVGRGVQAFATAFATTATAVTGLGIAATKVGIEYNGLRQTATAALTTLTGSAEGAADQMARLDEFGQNSWVMRDVLIQAQTQMLGFGIETEKVIPYLDALQEGVAAVGGSNQDFAELAEIMAQIQGTGRITAEELRMFGMRGVDAAGLIGQAMGKTGEQIRDEISSGSLDAEQALDALAESMMNNFEGATEMVLDTWQGAVSFVAGAWRDLGAELARPLVDPEGGGYFVEWAMGLSDILYAARDAAVPLVDLLSNRFAPALDRLTPGLQSAAEAIQNWDMSNLNSQLDTLTSYAPLIASVSAALFAMGTRSLPVIGGAINPVVAGFAALAATSPEVRTMLGAFADSLSPLLPVLGDLGTLLADTAMLVLAEMTPAISDLLVAGGDLASAFGTSLIPIVGDLLTAAAPLVGVLADVVTWVSELPDWVLAATTAFVLLRGPLSPVVDGVMGVARGFQRILQQSAVQATLGGTNQLMGGLAVASANARTAVQGVGTALRGAFMSTGIGLAISALAATLTVFATNAAEARQRAADYRDTLTDLGAVTDDTREKIVAAIAETRNENWLESIFGTGESIMERAEQFGIATEDIIGYILGEEDAIRRIIEATDEWVEAQGGERRERRGNEEAVRRFISLLDDEADGLAAGTAEQERRARANEEAANATGDAADASQRHAYMLEDEKNATEMANDAMREHIDLTREMAESNLSQAEAALRQEESQQRANDAIDRYNEVADNAESTTEDLDNAQRSMEQALIDLARQSLRHTDAMDEQDASAADLNSTIRQQREAFINTAREMGYTAEEARKLADDYGLIPNRVETEIVASGFGAAHNQITQFIRDQQGRKIYLQVEASGNVSYGRTPGPSRVGEAWRYEADGGIYDGPLKTFAAGGIAGDGSAVPRVPQIVQGGANILWGEPETGWEAYISGKPSMRTRNLQILDEAARRLGQMTIPANVTGRADGAVTGSAQVQTQRGGGTFTANIYGVPTNQADETAATLMRVWRTEQRRGLYSGSGV